jgi:hypothetical protein
MKKKLIYGVGMLVMGSFLGVASVPAEETKESGGSFDSFYFGFGGGESFVENNEMYARSENADPVLGAGLSVDGNDLKIEDRRAFSLMPSLVAGVGTTFWKKAYIGVEGLVDFSRSKSHNFAYHYMKPQSLNLKQDGLIKNSGSSILIGVRFGYLHSPVYMIYVRPSIVFSKTEIIDYDNAYYDYMGEHLITDSVQSFALFGDGYAKKTVYSAVALGLERIFDNCLSVRGELEYVFPKTLKARSKTYDTAGSLAVRYLEAKTSRINLRILVSYNIKY